MIWRLLERLTRCDDAAIAEIDARVSKLRGGRSELAAALRKARGTEPGPSADGRTRREAEPTDAIAIVDASPLEDHVAPQAHNDIIAKPFTWPDPATIPARQFLYGRHYIRKNIGATIGAGGRAKTTLGLTEAIGMASGRDLLGGTAITPLRVWCLNGEEDQDELDRRVTAICQHYGITEEQCGVRLFVQSVRDKPIRLATVESGAPTLNRVALAQIERQMRFLKVDVLMIDPLVSFHSLSENWNVFRRGIRTPFSG